VILASRRPLDSARGITEGFNGEPRSAAQLHQAEIWRDLEPCKDRAAPWSEGWGSISSSATLGTRFDIVTLSQHLKSLSQTWFLI
jgi:hypothetical protein